MILPKIAMVAGSCPKQGHNALFWQVLIENLLKLVFNFTEAQMNNRGATTGPWDLKSGYLEFCDHLLPVVTSCDP